MNFMDEDSYTPLQTNKLTNQSKLPTIVDEYHLLVGHKYTDIQLRTIAKTFGLKISGNKNELTKRIYEYMYFYKHVTKIQTAYRRRMARKYRELTRFRDTVNDSDFLTMEKLSEIPRCQFFSFHDTDGFVYGFDALSFYQLTNINGVNENPYNRKNFEPSIIEDFNKLVRLAKCLKLPLNVEMEEDIVTPEQKQELRVVELFQIINSLGNYANHEWFMNLDTFKLIKFLKELNDIWAFRSQITDMTKHNICPGGNPFRRFVAVRSPHRYDIRESIIPIIETLIKTGVDKDSKTLGSYYVLCALTLVSYDAAIALPWLYQSVQPHF